MTVCASRTQDLKQELQHYGIANENVRFFTGSASPQLLDYLDLIQPSDSNDLNRLLPDGVAESQGRPLLFFVNESRLSTSAASDSLFALQRIIACRGDSVYLARIRPGELLVTPVTLTQQNSEWCSYKAETGEALTFFSRLAAGLFDGKGKPDHADYVFGEMFNLLYSVADRLARVLGKTNVLSLIGRALFFRFLCDRQIVTEFCVKQIASQANELADCFDNAENAYATSQWLDRTFNGDFLPFVPIDTRSLFRDMAKRSKSVFKHLGAIVRGDEAVGERDYQQRLNWGAFDFAHVPVGLLSQVYEAFCWQWEHRSAKATSVHYTPRRIGATIVDEAFDCLPNAHNARVVDPACGAGVFLVLSFRRLYRERWLFSGVRPRTKEIREILDKQLVGFDISDSALKLSALSLYLTAIELDPDPIPPEKLRFETLINKVLFNHRRRNVDPDDGPVIGSLGEHVSKSFDGQFDLVVSNPPWTSLTRKHNMIAAEFTRVSRAVLERRGSSELARTYVNPDFAPDLPFLWKSTEWCKPDGRIAMALPARILFKQEEIPRYARNALFRLVEVTGIINGSNLSDTHVWPKMAQPFILLFARNRPAKPGHVLSFITPQYDKILNCRGEMRIDSKSADAVDVEETFETPWLWKALAVGTSLDVDVVRRIKSAQGRPLLDYWERNLNLASGNGYMVKEDQPQRDASFLRGLPDLNDTRRFHFVVDPEQLRPFRRSTVCWPRKPEIYRGPLVLVFESPGLKRESGWALLSFSDVVYTQSFYGYSAAGHSDGDFLVRYLHLFVHSLIWMHYALLTSPKFAAERRTVYKSILDDCPIFPIDALTSSQRSQVLSLSMRLERADSTVFDDVDTFFGGLYGMDRMDVQVIRDTLDVCLPYNESRMRACRVPTQDERETFQRQLTSVLRPFFSVLGKEPYITIWKPDDPVLRKRAPFGILLVGEQGREMAKPHSLFRDVIAELANDTGATRIIQHVEGGLLVGLLYQYRYWTATRARLLGAEIIRQHMQVFEV